MDLSEQYDEEYETSEYHRDPQKRPYFVDVEAECSDDDEYSDNLPEHESTDLPLEDPPPLEIIPTSEMDVSTRDIEDQPTVESFPFPPYIPEGSSFITAREMYEIMFYYQ